MEEALVKRRSVREYKDEALTLEEISRLLWAACGITSGWAILRAERRQENF